MKNNKGYYSWIHSLNRAGIESQHRGFNILNEAKRGRPSQFPEDLSDLQYDAAEHARIAAEKLSSGEELSNDRRRAAIAAIGKASPITLDPNLFDGPDGGSMADANEVARGQREAELDFEDDDWNTEMKDAAAIRADAIQNRAARYAEQDAAEEAAKNAEEEAYEEGEEARHWSGFSGRTGEVHESIFNKISKMMNG